MLPPLSDTKQSKSTTLNYWWQRILKHKQVLNNFSNYKAKEKCRTREEVCRPRKMSWVKKKAGKGRQEHHTKTFHLHSMKKHVISRVYREPDKNMKTWRLSTQITCNWRWRKPLVIFKKFLKHRPPRMRKTGPLYLSCGSNPSLMRMKKFNDVMIKMLHWKMAVSWKH